MTSAASDAIYYLGSRCTFSHSASWQSKHGMPKKSFFRSKTEVRRVSTPQLYSKRVAFAASRKLVLLDKRTSWASSTRQKNVVSLFYSAEEKSTFHYSWQNVQFSGVRSNVLFNLILQSALSAVLVIFQKQENNEKLSFFYNWHLSHAFT